MSKAKAILNTLLEEKKMKFKNGFYQYLQCSFAYNSNKIEGNQLSEDQVTNLYENRIISFNKDKDAIKVDDVLEIINHFRLFDYMLDNVYEKVDKEMILTFHKILKSGTTEEFNPIYNVGGFKTKPNIIGTVNGIQTSDPKDVESDIDALLKDYYSKETIQIEDIIEFHKKFETIHPLSDGNGRVGRMIMFKECIAHDIVPFVILNKDREFYIRGLREWNKEKGYLIDTCLNEQDIYKNICEQLHVFKEEC